MAIFIAIDPVELHPCRLRFLIGSRICPAPKGGTTLKPFKDKFAAANRIGLMRYIQTHEYPGSRQMGILGAERRAPPPVRLSPAVSSLLARIAQHVGLPDAKI